MSAPVQFPLKPLSKDGVPAALEKAMRYRLLNEPVEAESICLDILRVDPDHPQALVTLLLALTDRFAEGYVAGITQAEEIIGHLKNEYEKRYYAGIIRERRAKARLRQGGPGAGFDAFEWLHEAMAFYEKAQAVRPHGNDDALLRWNACARLIMKENLTARPKETFEPSLE